jgi:hypothetical protein
LFDDILSKPISEFFEDVLGTSLALPGSMERCNSHLVPDFEESSLTGFTAKQEFIFWEVH